MTLDGWTGMEIPEREENRMEHFRRNKRAYGALFVGVAAGLEAYGWREGAVVVGMVSAFLLGAGAMKSDAEVKAGK